MQNPHLRRISALCAARSFAYLYDMSALAALLRLELHPHLRVLQRSPAVFRRPEQTAQPVGNFGSICTR
ncbi:lipoprotein signal peptidase [Neisseria dumasiana]|uniref:Lipoprotein signal peptidase n=1 Tax=Neisseria dumasiana TaxID=1931275 RepID=A0A1X3DHK3_9NEIS|nr:lipoprotein signal peptidase [Neisseria dumasiana]